MKLKMNYCLCFNIMMNITKKMHIYFDAVYNIVFKVHEVYIFLYISFI